jgi:hypothetical protein
VNDLIAVEKIAQWQKLKTLGPLEIAALRASKARVFVLTAGNLRGTEIAAVFVRALPHIQIARHKSCVLSEGSP